MHAHKLPLGPRFSSSSSDFECVAGGGGERKGGNTFLQGTWLSRSYAHVQRKREGGREDLSSFPPSHFVRTRAEAEATCAKRGSDMI